MYSLRITTPLGAMHVRATHEGICELKFVGVELQTGDRVAKTSEIVAVFRRPSASSASTSSAAEASTTTTANADDVEHHFDTLLAELEQYFDRTLTKFTVPVAPVGTDFQRSVWTSLQNVPYGITRTYKDQAIAVGNILGIRAVAKANADNPIAIVIPCHRVIGTSGELTGYSGGLWRKRALLDLERKDTKPALF